MPRTALALSVLAALVATRVLHAAPPEALKTVERPNLLFILTDDQQYDAMGCAGNPLVRTPTIDRLAAQGVRFTHAMVTLSICSPGRAACLTGRYGSANGVTTLGQPLAPGEKTFADRLQEAGYATGYVGKWHLNQGGPTECGFDFAVWYTGNGSHYGRRVVDEGKKVVARGFIEDYSVDRSIAFIRSAVDRKRPFVLQLSTQIPHMTPTFDWEPRAETLATYDQNKIPLPPSWQDDLAGKPPYLTTARSRTKALEYGYDKPDPIRRHTNRYYAEITEMDASLGRLIDALDELKIADRTCVIFSSDNGWMIGDHGLTSKVLAYEPSLRVPLIVAGPDIAPAVRDQLVANIDIAPTLLDLAGLPVPANAHGRSLLPLIENPTAPWRDEFFYEAPTPTLGSWPHVALRTGDWKYIRTFDMEKRQRVAAEELYDLAADPDEMHNLAADPNRAGQLDQMRNRLDQAQSRLKK